MQDFARALADFVRDNQVWAAPIVLALAFCESLAFISLLVPAWGALVAIGALIGVSGISLDRKSTRLNSSHRCISYAVFCLKKKWIEPAQPLPLRFGVRVTNTARDRADMYIAEIDQPAVRAVRLFASGDVGHRPLKAPSEVM